MSSVVTKKREIPTICMLCVVYENGDKGDCSKQVDIILSLIIPEC